ncbi:hypothetical protein LOTGIDRAFT_239349 [Lottia gigantea]|uniref:Uncharacterized protein n=1 Tax=Lottia gigantea TaxID=225164 RepID=V4ANE3_LOTGI|nr:hypothetical protein LOTGIDRAFT_239349 [Lottia gigantea]ESO96295.1 hypothetical protein LOTGIDRAFT_239349 [Lottia gigantea]
MATLRKTLRFSIRGRRYSVLEGKENYYFNTPKYNKKNSAVDLNQNDNAAKQDEVELESCDYNLKRGSKSTRSVRDVVGNLKQKFRMSTKRRVRLQDAKSPRTPSRRRSLRLGGVTPKGDVKMLPFGIDSPSSRIRCGTRQRHQCVSLETPTRLRKEVESLTANMKALSALTPNTLRERTIARRTSPLTNGSLKTRCARRKIETSVY